MFILYDLIFIIFGLLSLPTFLFKLRQAESPRELIRERMGRFSPAFLEAIRRKPVIWIHAVSVGEVLGIRRFYDRLSAACPDHHILISTVTPTGQKMASEIAPGKTFYFPFDISWITKRVVKRLQPSVIVLMETELWPNLILQAARRSVPVCVINGRLSPRSFRSYYRVKWLIRSVVRKVAFFSAQTPRYQKRLRKLGISEERIWVTGNMKFDNVQVEPIPQETVQTMRETLGFKPQDRILMAGSTHFLEEDLVLEAYERLRRSYSDLKLLIAPRHVERAEEIRLLASHYGLCARVRTQAGSSSSDSFDVLVLDTIGELSRLYALAEMVIMGGSFIRHGGQSPIEPASQKKGILFGPHVFNFSDIYALLEKEGAALKIKRSVHLCSTLDFLLAWPVEAQEMGERAFRLIQAQQGATEKNLQIVNRFVQRERISHALSV